DDARFEIAGGVLKLRDGVSLDYETEPQVSLVITGRAANGIEVSSDITIQVENENEAPTAPVLSNTTVREDAQVIGTVTASDPDAGDTLTFTVDDPRFEIVDGVLQLAGGEVLDHEAEPFIDLTLTAIDANGLETSSVVRITVTNVAEAPTAPQLDNDQVVENLPGAVIGTVSVEQDPDGAGVTFTVDDARF
ncbi:hypothetical protein WG926_26560, partial [Tistrella sp. BH-R2-4]